MPAARAIESLGPFGLREAGSDGIDEIQEPLVERPPRRGTRRCGEVARIMKGVGRQPAEAGAQAPLGCG
ncbi:MAG: hypothetical protein GEU80_10290 [Dehalococcoidia bacterium]|nr:hypothetical protein [Dehalococcoidia bacterium]